MSSGVAQGMSLVPVYAVVNLHITDAANTAAPEPNWSS
jgi:hypothetical protein